MSGSPVLVRVERDGVTESVHHGDLVVATGAGSAAAVYGDGDVVIYPRSALKPFQAIATLAGCARVGLDLDDTAIAIAAASHTGSADHQVEAARLLALADLDETALGCPRALPADLHTLLDQREATALAHNCSGKHAGFLLAHVLAGGPQETYLDPATPLQEAVREHVALACDTAPVGPGVDGCGAPAWVMPLRALATGFARLAAGALGRDGVRVRDAMLALPEIVGGRRAPDTELMVADGRVVAKRGAEGVLAAGFAADDEPVGVAVKVADGAARAAVPALATALHALGAAVPEALRVPPVLGGGRPHGAVRTDPALLTACKS